MFDCQTYSGSRLPDIFLIPSQAWEVPNEIFIDRNYNKPGQKSIPEYGVNISKRNYSIREIFKFEDSIQGFL